MEYFCVSIISIIVYAYVLPVFDVMANLVITYLTVKRIEQEMLIEQVKIEIEKKHMGLSKYKFDLESDLEQVPTQAIGFMSIPESEECYEDYEDDCEDD